jgi:glyoxylase-like metal-dependent hydrolase (beta-lactamase superfamily II)
MRITFNGAARTVTGSQYLLEVNGSRVLLECGLFQGHRDETYDRNRNFRFVPSRLDAVLLTHAHIDHINALAEVKQATGASIAIHEDEAPSLRQQPFRMVIMPPPKPSPPPDRLLKDGDTIVVGKMSFKVLHTPGHTPGSISLFSSKNKLLIAGDALRKRRNTLYAPYRSISFDFANVQCSIRSIQHDYCDAIKRLAEDIC